MDTSDGHNCSQGLNGKPLPWKQLIREHVEADKDITLDEIFGRIINDTGVDFECLFMTTEFSGGGGGRKSLSTYKQVTLALSAIAVIANVLSLLAIYNIKKKLNANLRLIISLCAADLMVALCFMVLSSDNRLIPKNADSYGVTCVGIVLRSVRNGIHIVTLLNLLGLALDHYYAIVRTLHYRIVMNTQRVTWTIFVMWVVSFLLSFSDLYMPSAVFPHCKDHDLHLCDWAECTIYNSELLVFVITFITFVLLLYFYINIFVTLRKHNSILVRHRLIMQKKKQGTVTTIFILGTFVLFWLPYCMFDIIGSFITVTNMAKDQVYTLLQVYLKINYYLYDILLLNSVCDPLIYAWRMRDVQRGYKHMLASIMCYKHHIRQATLAHFRRTSLESMAQIQFTTTPKRHRMPLCYQGSHLSEESTTMNSHNWTTMTTVPKETLHRQLSNTKSLAGPCLDLRRISENHLEEDVDNTGLMSDNDLSAERQYHQHSVDDCANDDNLNKLMITGREPLMNYSISNNNNSNIQGEEILLKSGCTKNTVSLRVQHNMSTSSSDPNLCSIPLLSDQEMTSQSLPGIQHLVSTRRTNRDCKTGKQTPKKICDRMNSIAASSKSVSNSTQKSDDKFSFHWTKRSLYKSCPQNENDLTDIYMKQCYSICDCIQCNGYKSSKDKDLYSRSTEVMSERVQYTNNYMSNTANISMATEQSFSQENSDTEGSSVSLEEIIFDLDQIQGKSSNQVAYNCNQAASNCNHTAFNCNQAASNCNQSASNCNHTASNCNHTSLDCNQVASNRNQAASNCNQVASDSALLLAITGSPLKHSTSSQQQPASNKQNNRTKCSQKSCKEKWLMSKEKVFSHILNSKRSGKDSSLI